MKNVLPIKGLGSPMASGDVRAVDVGTVRNGPEDGNGKDGFESLIAELSGLLETRAGADLSDAVIWSLQIIGGHVGADRISLIETQRPNDDGGGVVYSQSAVKTGLQPLASVEQIRWLFKELSQGTAHVITTTDHLPRSASRDRMFLRSDRIESCIAAPLGQAVVPDFALLCESRQRNRWWTVDTLKRVTLAGRMIASAVRRNRADQTIIELRGRLVEARECERKRIARELHDDVSQRMAHLCLDLVRLKSDYQSGTADIAEIADELADRTRVLSTDIGRICRELYPSRMEQADLIAAIGNLCREFAGRHALEVEFEHKLGRKRVSQDTVFSLYRIAQEALHNVVKHSGASNAVIELRTRQDGIEMLVIDTGRGFDHKKRMAGQGLGLNSMRDRLQLIGGRLSIESIKGIGTRLEIRVPATMCRKTKGG